MSSDRVHLSVDDARALGEGALRGIGYDAEEAWIIADHVIDAALCGYEYSGLAKLLNIPEHSRFRLPRRPMHIVHETRSRRFTTAATMSAWWRCTMPPMPRSPRRRRTASR